MWRPGNFCSSSDAIRKGLSMQRRGGTSTTISHTQKSQASCALLAATTIGILFCVTPTHSAQVRHERRLAGTFPTVWSVQMLDANRIYAVGDSGLFTRSDDCGLHWRATKPLLGKPWTLRAVCFRNPANGIVAGQNGWIAQTVDGGLHWTTRTGSTSDFYESVSFPGPQSGFVVGDSGYVQRSTDGGFTWSRMQPAQENVSPIYASRFSNPLKGVIVGGVTDQFFGGKLLSTTDGGNSWDGVDDGFFCLRDVAFADSLTACAVGTCTGPGGIYDAPVGFVIVTSDGGNIWRRRLTPGFSNNWTGLALPAPGTAILVGDNTLVVTTDNGVSWTTRLTVESPASLNGISFGSPSRGVVGGANGLCYVTSDGGTTWTPVNVVANGSDGGGEEPLSITVSKIFPNPFNPEASVRIDISTDARVSVRIFDTLGREVASVLDSYFVAGAYDIRWTPSGVASGVYFFRIGVKESRFIRKAVFIR